MSSALNTSQRLIIELLRSQPAGMFGLDMIKASGGKLKRGTIYIHLGRLDELELVESRPDDPTAAIARRRYRLTRKGTRITVDESQGSNDAIPSPA